MASPASIIPPGKKPEQLEFYDVGTGSLVRVMAIEIEPGKHLIVEPNIVPPDVLPKYGICQFVRRPGGGFDAIAITHGTQIKLSTKIGRELGIKGEDGHTIYRTIKRLFYAGFITGEMITADSYYIDLHSLFKFFRQARNPGWWTAARTAHYNEHRDGPLEDPTGEYWRELRKKVESFNQPA